MPTLVAQPRASKRRPARRPPGRWWWRPRVRSALIIAALAAVTLVARTAAHLETDWLWFHELGQERVFWKLLTMRWLTGSAAGIATAIILLANFWVVARGAPPERARR